MTPGPHHGGFFVTLEGGEGSGKTTHAARLAARLREAGRSVVLTREPGGSPAAEAARAILLDAALALDPMTEALFIAAARRDHWLKTIRPALERGEVVLSDRFVDSTIAYQGHAGGAPVDRLATLNAWATDGRLPDLTLVLDLDPAIGAERARLRRGSGALDSFETRSADFHRRIREGLLAAAAADPARCVVIDADRPADAVAEDIADAVGARLGAPNESGRP
jgi:dTMP kinase